MVAVSHLWINGERRPASTGKTFDVVNGHTLEIVTKAASASMDDVYEAIEAAHKAQPAWEAVPWRAKRDLFIRAAQLVQTPKYVDQIVEAICQETANLKDWGRFNVGSGSMYLMEACSTVTQLVGETMPSRNPGGTTLIERRPFGTIFAISPFNAPFSLAARAIVVPLACGNTVLLKSSEQSPRCTEILVEALHEAGFPKGVLNLIHVAKEDAPKTVAEIIGHGLIRHINFTGSDVVGRIIAQEAGKHLKPCVLELGGKSAAIILNDANVEEAAKAILFGALSNGGQVCMSTERVIVQRGISESLIQTLKTMIEKIRAGADSSSNIPPLVSQSSAEKVIVLLKDSQKRGAELIVGDLQREGSVVKPHILLGGEPGWPVWDRESFGPMFLIKIVDTEEEAIELANTTEYSLMGAIWTGDIQKGLKLGRKIRAGHVNINGPTLFSEPGVGIHGLGGATGYGRFDVENFTQRHVMVISPPNLKYSMVCQWASESKAYLRPALFFVLLFASPPTTTFYFMTTVAPTWREENQGTSSEMSDPQPWRNDSLTSSKLASTSFNFANEDYIAFGFSSVDDYANDSLVISAQQIEAELSSKAKGKRTATEVDYVDGKDDGYRNKKQRKDTNSRSTPWVNQVDWSNCRNLAEILHKEVRAFVDYISPSFEEHEVRGMIITSVNRAIQSVWPDARVSLFGSYETKLYLPLGDIDLVIQSRAMEHQDKRRILYSLAHVLRKASITSNVQVIAKAKVPIVKFVTLHGRFSVDISLNQTNGLRAGSMINRLLAELPAVHPLVMTIKLFLNQRSMNEVYTGGLGSYALVCMVVSFLQMHPKIRAGEIDPMQNLGVLVIEFFELYGHYFNYEKTGISIRDGGTYFDKIARDWDDPRNPALLSIEDPVDITNDVSKNSFNMPRVRKTLAGAHEVLTAAAFMRCRVLMSKSRGSYVNLRQERDSEEQSILGSVMGVTQEILNHRRMVKQLYDRGVLQNLLGIPAGGIMIHKDTLIDQREALDAVEQAWRNNSDTEGEQTSRGGSQGNSDTEETSRYYSVRNPRKRRRIGSPSFDRKEMNAAVYVAESEDGEDYENDTSLLKESVSGRTSVSKPSSSKSDAQARRAYWASKGLSGGPEEGSE